MKKVFAFVLAMVMVACMFTACDNDSENNATVELHLADFAWIPGYDYLCYSLNTGTVYYRFSHCLSPYISNGHYCEYVNGEILEVVDGEKIAVVAIAN